MMPSFPEVVVLYMHFRVMDSSLLYVQFFATAGLSLENGNCKLFVVLFVENNSITVVDDCRRVYIGVDILSVEVKRLTCLVA